MPNRLLSALPPEEYRKFMTHGQEVTVELEDVFFESSQPVTNVYFMLDGMASVVAPMKGGESVEVLLVGREGMVGLQGLESSNHTVPMRAFTQMAGHAVKFNAKFVREEFNRIGPLNTILMRYFQFALVQISQNAACNRRHDLESRLARWLLMVRDRAEANTFMLTHDFLAQMLGTQRSSVTIAAGVLQRAGLIQYHRGEMTITNPEELLNATCECYEHIRASWDLLHKNHI